MYITSKGIIEKFKRKKVFIFGTGVDADMLTDDIKKEIIINAYADNKRGGAWFNGRSVITKSELDRRADEKSVVVIASYRFAHEILFGLDKSIWKPGENCFIWDDDCIFHMDDNTKRFITFHSNVWRKHKRNNKDIIVLVTYDNVHSASPILYAYFANCMAEKYDAEIWGMSSRGGDVRNESNIIKEVFRSFNVVNFVSPNIASEQQSIVDHIVKDIWEHIFTWEDWKNIKVLDMEMGTSIVRYINRFYVFDFDPRTEHNRDLLRECVEIIVGINSFFEKHAVKVVFLRDAVCWENFLREIAVSKGIPAYALQQERYYRKVGHDFCLEPNVIYYKEFWESLSEEEKEYGLKWAKKRLEDRLNGSIKDIPYMAGRNVFACKERKKQLRDSDNIKILICPHIFEEDSYVCGEQIFDNNYISWLDHLGKLSEITPKCDRYIKLHPNLA